MGTYIGFAVLAIFIFVVAGIIIRNLRKPKLSDSKGGARQTSKPTKQQKR